MDQLIAAIRQYVSLTAADIEWINKLFAEKKIRKNDSFLMPGEVCNTFAFIEMGLFRHSIFDKMGEEKVIYFSSDNDFICDYDSFISRLPSKKSIIALEDTTVSFITHDNLQIFYNKVSSGERFGRLYLENIYNKIINHIISIHTDSSAQMYLNFIAAFKHIQNRIPQYYIASFVGVTPQSLSRIRRNLVKK